ncbi:MAG: hypothetical protein K8T25_17445 [Planctomycetia bacterium]|nr:hypothetical protein [Planctomycetia bacterium]
MDKLSAQSNDIPIPDKGPPTLKRLFNEIEGTEREYLEKFNFTAKCVENMRRVTAVLPESELNSRYPIVDQTRYSDIATSANVPVDEVLQLFHYFRKWAALREQDFPSAKFFSRRNVSFADTQVSDSEIGILRYMSSIEVLDLSNTQVTDAGLSNLKDLTTLKRVDLRNTQVTEVGVTRLQKSLPKCKIEH